MGYPGDFLNRFGQQADRHARPGDPAQPRPPRFSWVPIRSLAARHRDRIEAHLVALEPGDRYLRFGFPASDEQIRQYVQGIRFDRDEVFGIFNRRLQLIAMAHLAYEPVAQQLPGRPTMVEFGVSVLESARGRGYGARLFDHAVMHARNRGIDSLYIHALSENHAMLRIARNAGAKVERDGGESQAWLKLEPDTIGSQMEAMVEAHAAEMNYQLKRQALRLEEFIDGMQELKQQIGRRGPGSQ
ncbi:GNAT family N-acetyltransferase [Rivibacter subsaxonicus]|nr:GNAT family N-acetyltransferase [Rivibacter subsaxonicus]